MSINDVEYIAWTKRPQAQRCLLVEVDYYHKPTATTGTFYFSNFGYVTNDTDSPANVSYRELILNDPYLRYKKGEPLAVSEIQLANGTGEFDSWFSEYVFDGRAIRYYLGDQSWARADFRLRFSGIIKEALPSDKAFILRIRDKKELFNVPLHKVTYVSGDAKNQLWPVALGQCFNVTPVLVDGSTHRYQFHARQAGGLTLVKDNGVSTGFTPNLSSGEFYLSAPPVGTITCDALGDAVGGYVEYLGDVIYRIFTYSGLTAGEIDSASFASFNAAYPVKVGKYLTSRTITVNLISELLNNVGADYYFSSDGKARLWALTPPVGNVKHQITDYIAGSFNVSNVEAPAWKLRLGVDRNYTTQTFNELDDSLTTSQKNALTQEFATILEASDPVIKTTYLLAEEPDLIASDLIDDTAAQNELGRQLALKAVPHINFSLKTDNYTPLTSQLDLRLGDEVSILIGRVGFASLSAAYQLKTLGELNWGVDPLGAYKLTTNGVSSTAILTGVTEYLTSGFYELDFWK